MGPENGHVDRDDLIGRRVDWEGQLWFVALAQHDTEAEGDEGHWHLTLTSPKPHTAPPRCGHARSVSGCRYCADAFVQGVADRLGVERERQYP